MHCKSQTDKENGEEMPAGCFQCGAESRFFIQSGNEAFKKKCCKKYKRKGRHCKSCPKL